MIGEEQNDERWHVQAANAMLAIHDENGLTVAVVSGDGRELTVKESAHVLAAAPALRDALARLFDWVQDNVPTMPRALAEDCGQALEDAKVPQ